MRKLIRAILLAIIVNGLAVWLVSELFDSLSNTYELIIISDPAWLGFALVGLIVGFVNAFVKPILKALSLPLIILTFGLFLIIINALTLWLVTFLLSTFFFSTNVQVIVNGGFISYVLLGVTLGIINTFLHWIFKSK